MASRRPPAGGTFTQAQRARLRALVDAIPRPLFDGIRGDRVTEPCTLAALDYFDEVWRGIWRSWQHEGGSRPPRVPAIPCYGGVWLLSGTPEELINDLDGFTDSAGD